MEDVRTKRRSDINLDHNLVVAMMKLKPKKRWNARETALQRFNIAFLRDIKKLNKFKITLNNRFQALQDLRKDKLSKMEDNWKDSKEALTSTCQEVLGCKKHYHKQWISMKTFNKVQDIKNKKKNTAINNS
ncbi:unnamed protein product [Schistosoma margrebowiei]|uniref:Uncharacterized protein n=1 Tax=Schistosoma margrebowiei TaxID=48269 RepID=A0A183N4L9_9TREM|nr:unnamed protein product [Schistosoma margrebowiei]